MFDLDASDVGAATRRRSPKPAAYLLLLTSSESTQANTHLLPFGMTGS